MLFQNYFFIHILYDNTTVFRRRSWSDVFYVSMTHNSHLSWLNAPTNYPLFYNGLVSPKKYICVSVTGFYASCSSSLFFSTFLSISLPLPVVSNSLWLS
ncbi:unnamed protein product [Hymenolepis diminuta]|uniref:Uncharacterized protein n=1 Tax=Hymenolepis diminuta TaxID=6216 RepID=A0A564YKZ7_HYMDI|nr:unnamed protein product [Hymenolepis diminuta]